ncbi:P-type conjugative transfer ATPase TrbB (plasmid) [Photobacterium damselae subsp. damselae]|uniref:P-type conjugative transfer ATPase TrbB n=2 Tax=Photobacterium damselae TaxID=38293 RepID=UPI00311AD646
MSDAKQRSIKSLNSHLERTGILALLNDESVIEIMLNSDGWLWVEAFGKPMYKQCKISPDDANIIIRSIAHFHGELVDKECPILECELPTDGSRFEGIVPPLTAQTSFTIRKKATKVFTLDDYFENGTMTEKQYNVIQDAVATRQNILIVGGTGSGKTTLTNAVIDSMVKHNEDDRIIIIEDTNEIQCAADNSVIMRTSEKASVTMGKLLRVTLRYRPDRILVGEVRGGEALDLLKAWNTGHPGGVATIHANSALLGLERLEQCIEEVSTNVNRKVIAQTINLVIFIKKTQQGRTIEELAYVHGHDGTHYDIEYI